MPVPELNQGQNAQREVVLWDLAGQPRYRIVHQLHLGGGAVALPTSAKEGWGVAELLAAILGAIDWTRMPVVTSSALFAAAKSFVLDQKAAGTPLTPLASLPGRERGAGWAAPAGGVGGGHGQLVGRWEVWVPAAGRPGLAMSGG